MILTDHQLQVTADAASKFRTSIKELSQIPEEEIIDQESLQNHIGALRLQAKELEAEVAEYKQIKSGKVEIKVKSLSELGIALIKTRIMSGMDQATLANLLGVSESKIEVHESEKYSYISIFDLRKVAKILNVEIPEDVLPSHINGKMNGILAKLKKAGLDRKFVLSRLVKPDTYEKIVNKSGVALDQYVLGLYKHINHIFGWTWEDLTDPRELIAPNTNSANVKFKIESNQNPNKINVYSTYARYLANVATDISKPMIKKDIPTNAIEMRKAIIDNFGSINLENTLDYAWDCGVIVLPLNDKGNFHGACMRINGQNVIVLNPRKLFMATWLFDLLHELSHAGQEPDKESFDEIKEVATSHKRRTSKEEIDANDFANAVILGKKANSLLDQCITQARGNLNLLKDTILKIAKENNVMIDALANYVAHTSKADSNFKYKDLLVMAESLQLEEGNPYEITRDKFTKRFPFKFINGIDPNLLIQAIEDV